MSRSPFEDRGIDLPLDSEAYHSRHETSMLSPTGSADTGHGASPTSLAHTVTETDVFSDSELTQSPRDDHYSRLTSENTSLRRRVEELEAKDEAHCEKEEELRTLVAEYEQRVDELQRKNEDLYRTNVYIEEHRDEIPDDASCDTSVDEPTSSQQKPGYRRRMEREHDVVGLLNETEELSTENKKLQSEMNRLQRTCNELQETSRKARAFEQMCEAQKGEIDRLTRLHDDHAKQIEYLNGEIMSRDSKIRAHAHLEAKVKRLGQELAAEQAKKAAAKHVDTEEVIRMETQLKRREKEIGDLERRLESVSGEREAEVGRNKSLQEELDRLKQENATQHADWQKERDDLVGRLEGLETQLKQFESARQALADIDLFPADNRTRQSTELNASTSTVISSGTESEEIRSGLWKLLPEEIRRQFAEFAISDEDRSSSIKSIKRSIRKLKKLTVRVDVEGQRILVSLPAGGDSTLSLARSVENMAPRKVLRDVATDCLDLWVAPVFDRSMTPRDSRDSLFLDNMAGPQRVDSRDRLLLEEIDEVGRNTHQLADELNNAVLKSIEAHPVNVSVQAVEQSPGSAQEALLQRTVDNLRKSLDSKNMDIDTLNLKNEELLEENEELAKGVENYLKEVEALTEEKSELRSQLEEFRTELEEARRTFQLERESLLRQKADYRAECESLRERVASVENNAVIYRRRVEELETEIEEKNDHVEELNRELHELKEQLRRTVVEKEEFVHLANTANQKVQQAKADYEKLQGHHDKMKKLANEKIDRMTADQKEKAKLIDFLQRGNYDREKFIKVMNKKINALVKYVQKHFPEESKLLRIMDELSMSFSTRSLQVLD